MFWASRSHRSVALGLIDFVLNGQGSSRCQQMQSAVLLMVHPLLWYGVSGGGGEGDGGCVLSSRIIEILLRLCFNRRCASRITEISDVTFDLVLSIGSKQVRVSIFDAGGSSSDYARQEICIGDVGIRGGQNLAILRKDWKMDVELGSKILC
ncbi:hypothetical protein RHMOL_Rhmol04G0215300 [Rhododendron molle]|uniref:Uncharacterized protein n=1 Tax=Rhododendron molle TaxID=49168 RepID=A0ACC0P452_RHOML|nr:hypothetical protein RHMOL_Rhmol04G0215300 [Rhododendron molle]